nr:BON domain-containing protein [Azospirillum oleiclasticum]
MAELERDPSINAAHIGVAAEHAVQRVKGVRGIAMDVTVRLASDRKRSDPEIAERALKSLDWAEFVPRSRIMVEAEDGILTLRGTVDWQYEKTAAEYTVRSLSGVRGIRNEIAVAPSVAAGGRLWTPCAAAPLRTPRTSRCPPRVAR